MTKPTSPFEKRAERALARLKQWERDRQAWRDFWQSMRSFPLWKLAVWLEGKLAKWLGCPPKEENG